jgi:uncharacterized protein YcsI (UPF0317 family)
MASCNSTIPAQEARGACRSGLHRGPTAGLAPGFVQGNLAILPKDVAADFLLFALSNPKPCPIIGVSEPGIPTIPKLGSDLDVRTDLPGYRIWRDGEVTEEVSDISNHWRDDLVAFVIGCSFSFEEALSADGLHIRHIDEGRNVPMYRTNIPCTPAGPFHGPMVVSMRPFHPSRAIRAIQITTRFPSVHGAPVHIGRPDLIGIQDLSQPDYGDAVTVGDDEIPVFWACGVTPQAIIRAARVPFAITHAPGCMLVTDRLNSEFSVL